MDITNFIKDCKNNGLNVTYQRIAIYKALMENSNHPTAEDIFEIVKKEYPTISLATVYKNLETLTEYSIISKVTPLHNLARYDGKTEIHHHLICIKCKLIIDIKNNDFDKLSVPENMSVDFSILNHQVQFNGICNKCA